MRNRHLIVGLAVGSLLVGASSAQDKKSLKDQLADFTTDLSVSASPAAAHVGLSQEKVLMPRNRRAFEAGLSKIVSNDGKPVGTLEASPYFIARGPSLSYATYRDDLLYQAMTRTTVGIASGKRKVESAEISANGYSLSSVLLDLGDPVFSYALQACINRVQAKALARAAAAAKAKPKEAEALPDANTKEPFQESDERPDPEAKAEYKACITKREPELWNRTRVSVGLASGSGQEVAGLKRSIDFGNAVWLSAQYGFEGLGAIRKVFGSGDRYLDCDLLKANGTCAKTHAPDSWEQNAMLTLHVGHVRGASDLDLSKTGALSKQDSTVAAVRLSYGSDKRNVFLEASRAWVDTEVSKRRLDQHALGASFQVQEGLWLNVVNGRRKSFVNGKLDNVVELNLQFGASKDPVIVSPKPAS